MTLDEVLLYVIVGCIVAAAVGAGIGYMLRKRIAEARIGSAEEKARQIGEEAKKMLDNASREAETLKKETLVQTREEIHKLREDVEQENKQRRDELQKYEQRLVQKENNLDWRSGNLEQRESQLDKKENQVKAQKEKLNGLYEQQQKKLEEISQLSSEQAKDMILSRVDEELTHEKAVRIRSAVEEAKSTADVKAREIIAAAIQRNAADTVSETTVSVVSLPNEEMKGRIIGREGRNIRAIEAATGVDLIIDDTPETVILSAYNPLRREVAKRSLERLISDGRIHPARIEDIVKKVEKEMDVQIREIGEQATFDLGVHGIHPEIVRLLGQLRFRTSFTQNVLQHSLEVAFLCGIMAAELGLDIKKAKRAGLLHDLGKAVDHEVEGPHALIGADLAKKYNESAEIVHAIAAHHEDVPPKSVYAVLVQAADSLSGARPGARKELLESYVKRLEELEGIATGFNGVSRAFAIQAGREVRVMVDCDAVNDDQIYMLSKDIAKQIEEKMTYPGQIRVTVIREKRAVGIAK